MTLSRRGPLGWKKPRKKKEKTEKNFNLDFIASVLFMTKKFRVAVAEQTNSGLPSLQNIVFY